MSDPRIGRRAVVGAGLIGGAWAAPAAAQAQRGGAGARDLRPDETADASAARGRALASAAAEGRELRLGPGIYRIGDVALPSGTRLVGTAGRTVLAGLGNGPVLRAASADRISLEGLTLRGSPAAGPDTPLLLLTDIRDLDVSGLSCERGSGTGIRSERCGGRIAACRVSGCDTGIFTLDATGLAITGNIVDDCADNGILVWRSAKGFDGTLVSGNRISRIRNRSGGSGEYGNGVNIFRAGSVVVSGNVIRDCTFSAVRNNAGENIQIAHNNCTRLGEVAIFVEFGFMGCVVSGNVVDRASVGVSMTNYNEGGRLASCTGNMLRNLFRRPDALTGVIGQGIGIAAEADATVTGNVVEAAEFVGIWIGYGPHQRDVLCSANVVRETPVGIAASVAPGAGTAHISGNLLSGCTKGGVVGFEWEKVQVADLARSAAYGNVTVAGNTVR